MKRLAFALLILTIAPAVSSAQVAWDAPSMIRPGAPSGLTILLHEPYPGDDIGALVLWRQSPAPVGLGIRAGITEDPGGDLAALFGLDVSGPLADLDGAGDPQVLWWSGAGLGVGNDLIVTFPAGMVLGWNIAGEGIVFSPSFGGHLALDIMSGPGDDLDLDGSVDLGVDLGFDSGLQVRFGASVGGRDALAVGLRLPM